VRSLAGVAVGGSPVTPMLAASGRGDNLA
jgi:hypothetical protein